ncbi:MAG: tyrosine-type recombinase/integrase [Bacteroidales bacterium]|nr:tyrosine-type recombinase/integrase [Bacteroidales bacterium]
MAKRKNTRRGNNEGCITQRVDGRWIGQIVVGHDENGKRIRKSFYGKTRSEVALKMTTDLNAVLKNGYKTVSNEKFETLFMEWLLIFKRNTVLPRTLERILSNVKVNILPEIGQFTLSEFNPQIIQRFINKLYLKDFSLDTIKKSKQIVSQFFEYAIDNEMATTNPTTKIKIQKRDKHIQDGERYKALPQDIRQEFLNALNKHEFLKPLCTTMMFAGLRIGEVLALTWRDVDFDKRLIAINQAITVDMKLDKMGNVISKRTVIADTKTACSVRVVPMPEKLYENLQQWKEARWLKGRENGLDLLKPESLIFGNNDGMVRTYYGTKSVFDRFLRNNGFSKYKLHFHAFRQTFSNIMFENNVNPKITQMLLGHKEVSTTIRNYNSVDKTYFDKTANIINEQFK